MTSSHNVARALGLAILRRTRRRRISAPPPGNRIEPGRVQAFETVSMDRFSSRAMCHLLGRKRVQAELVFGFHPAKMVPYQVMGGRG